MFTDVHRCTQEFTIDQLYKVLIESIIEKNINLTKSKLNMNTQKKSKGGKRSACSMRRTRFQNASIDPKMVAISGENDPHTKIIMINATFSFMDLQDCTNDELWSKNISSWRKAWPKVEIYLTNQKASAESAVKKEEKATADNREVAIVNSNNDKEVAIVNSNNGKEVAIVNSSNGKEVEIVNSNNDKEVVIVNSSNGKEVETVNSNNDKEVAIVNSNNGKEVEIAKLDNRPSVPSETRINDWMESHLRPSRSLLTNLGIALSGSDLLTPAPSKDRRPPTTFPPPYMATLPASVFDDGGIVMPNSTISDHQLIVDLHARCHEAETNHGKLVGELTSSRVEKNLKSKQGVSLYLQSVAVAKEEAAVAEEAVAIGSMVKSRDDHNSYTRFPRTDRHDNGVGGNRDKKRKRMDDQHSGYSPGDRNSPGQGDTTLHIGNLYDGATEGQIRSIFSRYGTLRDCSFHHRYAFVTLSAQAASVAITAEDGRKYCGRSLCVSEAWPRGRSRF